MKRGNRQLNPSSRILLFKGITGGETKRNLKKKNKRRERKKKREAFRLFRLSRTNLPSCKRHRRVVLTGDAPGRSRLRAGYTRPTFRPPEDLRNQHRNEATSPLLRPFSLVLAMIHKPDDRSRLSFFSWKESGRKAKSGGSVVIYRETSSQDLSPMIGFRREWNPVTRFLPTRTEFIALWTTPLDSSTADERL